MNKEQKERLDKLLRDWEIDLRVKREQILINQLRHRSRNCREKYLIFDEEETYKWQVPVDKAPYVIAEIHIDKNGKQI